MIRNKMISKVIRTRPLLSSFNYSKTSVDIEKLDKESTSIVDAVSEEEVQLREAEIETKRNKSRLKDSDRNFLLEQNPYPEPTRWHHGTLKYMRRLYGRYGQQSGVNPAICWPVKEELQSTKEYEKIAYPFTIPQMVQEAKQRRSQKEEEILARQADIVKKIEKLEDWKKELVYKIAKKEKEASAAKERKERLMEEVRMHFGYTVDPKEDKFKELLEKKEKEQKKAMKEARKKAREEEMLAKMLSSKKSSAKESKNKEEIKD